MRDQLARIEHERCQFSATFVRFGMKRGYKGRMDTTLLFCDVRDAIHNHVVCDHIWFTSTKAFDALKLQNGDKVLFHARVKSYEKGYKGYRDDVWAPIETDYKLSHPTRVQKVQTKMAGDAEDLPLFACNQSFP